MQPVAIVRVVADDVRIRVGFDDGRTIAFHHIWLRDNCRCKQCHHADTHERLVDILDLDPDVQARSFAFDSDTLTVTWPDGHRSAFDALFLRRHAYDEASLAGRRDNPRLWLGSELACALPEARYSSVVSADDALAEFLETLWTNGLVIVRDTPDTDDALAGLCSRISWMRETNFGVDFVVEAKVEPNNVAYTALELHSHTDLPNREMPPGVQFLHCRVADAPGGANTLVDGFAAAEALREVSPEDYEILTTVEVPYTFVDDDYDVRWRAPVIGTFGDGTYREVRYHHALMAPLDVAAESVLPVYRALQAFTRILREPGRALHFRMSPGDTLVFHNRRVLHGRQAFDPAGGHRHLHGGYVDVDELRSKMRVLARKR